MFATGIENSIPVINNGRTRIDELAKCRHYDYWQNDFELVKELDIQFLCYGPPIYKTFLGSRKYEWDFSDMAFRYLQRLSIMPIVDLCYFGVSDWIGNFQNRLSLKSLLNML